MLPALCLVVACYTTLRFVEILSNKDTATMVRTVAIPLLLLSLVSCSVAVFGGATPTP